MQLKSRDEQLMIYPIMSNETQNLNQKTNEKLSGAAKTKDMLLGSLLKTPLVNHTKNNKLNSFETKLLEKTTGIY